ncbi:hypothetical protein K7X08_006654 [Anisodus acutangulus]|uniref:Uncharacterized protein n=1 Tax=Anisodus acutangulus TaxID=402998 RepID=A0A9Q1MZI7_9SOLA|nr:hypothetical protein K7X08_006654 [Anisodus acutangulus]
MYCNGIEFLNIISSQLNYLFIVESQYRELYRFINSTSLSVVSLSSSKVLENPKQDERSTLLKFIFDLPMLSELYLDTFYLKFLGEAPIVPTRAPNIRNCLRHIMLSIDLTDLAQISYALLFIQCFFNLQMLQIWVHDTCNSAEDVLNYLEAPHNFGRPLPNLKQIVIRWFNGSKPELLLIKLLFAATPSLVRMSIKKERNFSSIQERNITTELMRYPRASPKAELIYL